MMHTPKTENHVVIATNPVTKREHKFHMINGKEAETIVEELEALGWSACHLSFTSRTANELHDLIVEFLL